MKRRRFVALMVGLPATLGLATSRVSWAQSRAVRRSNALRIGADPVAESLVRALLQRFGRETGLAAQFEAAPSAALLTALEQGEIDAVITGAPDMEQRIEKQGLLHDRRLLGHVETVLVGPTDGPVPPRSHDVVDAMGKIAAAGARFIGRSDGSALHLQEQGLWRAAAVAPVAPWYLQADASPIAQARAYRAYVIVERVAVSAGAPRDKFGPIVTGDPRLDVPLHVTRSFRSAHAAGKLFVSWTDGAIGRRVIAGQPGIRAATAPTTARARS
jgi:tungstate transport system substrate-binding protein